MEGGRELWRTGLMNSHGSQPSHALFWHTVSHGDGRVSQLYAARGTGARRLSQ